MKIVNYEETEKRTLPMTVRDAIRLIERDGWIVVCQTVGHGQYHQQAVPRPEDRKEQSP